MGTYLGAVIGQAPQKIKKYLGLALLPVAGVTIGLTLDAHAAFSSQLPELSNIMMSTIVGATLINEFTAPFLVRYALIKSGEAA